MGEGRRFADQCSSYGRLDSYSSNDRDRSGTPTGTILSWMHQWKGNAQMASFTSVQEGRHLLVDRHFKVSISGCYNYILWPP
jgi:hypothetical protein